MARIVVLDDVREHTELVESRLKFDGHDIRVASDGEEAIDLAYLFEPDILITDWDLQSDYDGFEVAEAFQATNSNIKTIIVSGHCSIREEYQRLALSDQSNKLGLIASFVKPFSIDHLARTVSGALNSIA